MKKVDRYNSLRIRAENAENLAELRGLYYLNKKYIDKTTLKQIFWYHRERLKNNGRKNTLS